MVANPNGFKPPPTFVAREGWIIDGHHRWSSYQVRVWVCGCGWCTSFALIAWSDDDFRLQWAAQQGGASTMPITVIDIEIDELMSICDSIRADPSSIPLTASGKPIVSFSGLLELQALSRLKAGSQSRMLGEMKHAWTVNVLHQLRLAGLSHKGSLESLSQEWEERISLVR